MQPLSSLCKTNIATKEDSFVGLAFDDGMPKISFPMGYSYEKDDEGLRKDICLLLSCIQNNNCAKLNDEKAAVNSDLKTTAKFPFLAYKFIIDDYFRNGVYSSKIKCYKKDSRGKIDWKKTIKTVSPYVQGNSFVYNKYVVQKQNVNELEILTNIHRYCIFESCQKIGWLYNDIKFQKPNIQINKVQFIAILNKALNETFVDETRRLINNMINIIKGLDDSSDNMQEYKVGTYRFEYLWEYMLDKKFGIINKQDYFPRATWLLNGGSKQKSPLELDTIFFHGDDAYIVDAKYYKYGITRHWGDLPETSTIAKQVIYGQFVCKKTGKKVYNAFVLPYGGHDVENLGQARVDWMEEENEYSKIKLIVYDTKRLMESYLYTNVADKEELIRAMQV